MPSTPATARGRGRGLQTPRQNLLGRGGAEEAREEIAALDDPSVAPRAEYPPEARDLLPVTLGRGIQLVRDRRELGRHRFQGPPLLDLPPELSGDRLGATLRIQQPSVHGADEKTDAHE